MITTKTLNHYLEALGSVFVHYAWRMQKDRRYELAMRTCGYPVVYVMSLFALLLIDPVSLAQILVSGV